uniref:Putative 8.9 kDa protein n=1 Tax=Amblyomma tuberculatum TaxID=48802 RepID=A0A6M2E3N0_9ACAR
MNILTAIFLSSVIIMVHCEAREALEQSVLPEWDTNVTVIKGKCWFWGRKIKVGQPRAIKNPCVQVACMATATPPAVLKKGCFKYKDYGSSCTEHKGENKRYPLCCPRLYCENRPTL